MMVDQYRPGSNIDFGRTDLNSCIKNRFSATTLVRLTRFNTAVVKLGQPKILHPTGSVAYCDARECCVKLTFDICRIKYLVCSNLCHLAEQAHFQSRFSS